MGRALMPKLFTPCLTIIEETPDGAAEVVLTVNGHFVASTVVCNEQDSQFMVNEWWRQEVLRKC